MYPTIRNSLLTFASATQLDEHAIFIPKETRLSLQDIRWTMFKGARPGIDQYVKKT